MPFKTVEKFTLINFWKVVLVSRIPNFRGVKRHLKLSRKGCNPGSNKREDRF